MNAAPFEPAPRDATELTHVLGADGVLRTAKEHQKLFGYHPSEGLKCVDPRAEPSKAAKADKQ